MADATQPMTIIIGGGMRLTDDMHGGHAHTCPECHEHVPCEQTCAVEPDLTLDDGTPRGGYVVCIECTARPRG